MRCEPSSGYNPWEKLTIHILVFSRHSLIINLDEIGTPLPYIRVVNGIEEFQQVSPQNNMS